MVGNYPSLAELPIARSDRGDSLLVLNIQEKRWGRQEKPGGCMQNGVKEKVKRTEE